MSFTVFRMSFLCFSFHHIFQLFCFAQVFGRHCRKWWLNNVFIDFDAVFINSIYEFIFCQTFCKSRIFDCYEKECTYNINVSKLQMLPSREWMAGILLYSPPVTMRKTMSGHTRCTCFAFKILISCDSKFFMFVFEI